MEIKENTIILEQFEFTADDLRNIANAMDNPMQCLVGYKNIKEFIEKIGVEIN